MTLDPHIGGLPIARAVLLSSSVKVRSQSGLTSIVLKSQRWKGDADTLAEKMVSSQSGRQCWKVCIYRLVFSIWLLRDIISQLCHYHAILLGGWVYFLPEEPGLKWRAQPHVRIHGGQVPWNTLLGFLHASKGLHDAAFQFAGDLCVVNIQWLLG